MRANLFDVLDKVNNLPGGKLHAYFADCIKTVNREIGKTHWGDIKMAINSEDAGKIITAIAGGESTVSVMLFVVDKAAIDQIKAEIEVTPLDDATRHGG